MLPFTQAQEAAVWAARRGFNRSQTAMAAQLDAVRPRFDAHLSRMRPGVVINIAGPFQNQGYPTAP
jgi:hypothetical protein